METVSFFITLQQILFTSHVDLKDSSVADVSKILPLIIVAQCYLLLKMVWCIYFKMRKKKQQQLESNILCIALDTSNLLLLQNYVAVLDCRV